MDDYLFYSILACGLLGVILAAVQKLPGCAGSCEQGRKSCNCK
jgi:hypothetical protein